MLCHQSPVISHQPSTIISHYHSHDPRKHLSMSLQLGWNLLYSFSNERSSRTRHNPAPRKQVWWFFCRLVWATAWTYHTNDQNARIWSCGMSLPNLVAHLLPTRRLPENHWSSVSTLFCPQNRKGQDNLFQLTLSVKAMEVLNWQWLLHAKGYCQQPNSHGGQAGDMYTDLDPRPCVSVPALACVIGVQKKLNGSLATDRLNNFQG